jgi:hypothetical protein
MIKNIIASAIANARGMRRGMPPISNVMSILPDNLKKEVLDDADNILRELKKAGFVITETNEKAEDPSAALRNKA